MTKPILITRPAYDDTTHYLFFWSSKSIETAKSKGIKILDLSKERANAKEVASILSKINPLLVILNGHGSEDSVCGHKGQILIQANKNEVLLKEKIVYAISCSSSKILGPKAVSSGAQAYIGYDDVFIFTYDQDYFTHPLEDKKAKLFFDPSNELVLSLIKGNSVQESCNRSKQGFKENIRKLLSTETPQEYIPLLRYLFWDMKHQVFHGDGNSTY